MNVKKALPKIALTYGIVGIVLVLAYFLVSRQWSNNDTVEKLPDTVVDTVVINELGAIAKAKGQELNDALLQKEAYQFGLKITYKDDEEAYRKIRERLFTNDALVSALNTAKDNNITVRPRQEFQIYSGYVLINVNASDEEIIKFLLGSELKSEEN